MSASLFDPLDNATVSLMMTQAMFVSGPGTNITWPCLDHHNLLKLSQRHSASCVDVQLVLNIHLYFEIR